LIGGRGIFVARCATPKASVLSAEPNSENPKMISRRTALSTLAGATLIAGNLPAFGKSSRSSPVQLLDTDNDGTVDLAEAKKAASALFDRLDRDHDGTLDKRELAGRLSAKEFAAADPDHDGTLTKDEYLAVVEQRFNAANADSDGTLDAKELATKAGRKLMQLLK
jgi:EF hand